MTVTLSQIIRGQAAMASMRIQGVVPYKTLRALHKMRDCLANEVEVAITLQNALAEKYHGKANEAGIIGFGSPVDKSAFLKEWDEAKQTIVELEADPVDLSGIVESIAFENADADLEALSAFVKFEG